MRLVRNLIEPPCDLFLFCFSSAPGRKRSLDGQRATEAAFNVPAPPVGIHTPATIDEQEKRSSITGSEDNKTAFHDSPIDEKKVDLSSLPVPKSNSADSKTVDFASIPITESPQSHSPLVLGSTISPEIISPRPVRASAGPARSTVDLGTGHSTSLPPSAGASISAPATPALVEAIERGRKRTLGAVSSVYPSGLVSGPGGGSSPAGGKKMLFKVRLSY